MKRSLRTALAAGLVAAMPSTGAAELVCGPDAPLATPVRLEYTVTATRSVLSLTGDGVVTYQRTGNEYAMASTLKAAGVFEAEQRSHGSVGSDGLVPRQFTQRTSRRPLLTVDFDWPGGQVAFSLTGTHAATLPQMQDRLSLLFQLAWRHRAEPRAATLTMPVAGNRSTSTHLFVATEGDPLTLPAGRFDTVRFELQGHRRGDSLEVWLAPELCSLPVRARFADERGTVVEQRLRAVRPLTP
jgi:hypothetical protein